MGHHVVDLERTTTAPPDAVWRWLADSFPFVYVPPLELFVVIAIVPAALLVANALAAGPARTAARIRPADVLRAE